MRLWRQLVLFLSLVSYDPMLIFYLHIFQYFLYSHDLSYKNKSCETIFQEICCFYIIISRNEKVCNNLGFIASYLTWHDEVVTDQNCVLWDDLWFLSVRVLKSEAFFLAVLRNNKGPYRIRPDFRDFGPLGWKKNLFWFFA
jgi:hypothetical protein